MANLLKLDIYLQYYNLSVVLIKIANKVKEAIKQDRLDFKEFMTYCFFFDKKIKSLKYFVFFVFLCKILLGSFFIVNNGKK